MQHAEEHWVFTARKDVLIGVDVSIVQPICRAFLRVVTKRV